MAPLYGQISGMNELSGISPEGMNYVTHAVIEDSEKPGAKDPELPR